MRRPSHSLRPGQVSVIRHRRDRRDWDWRRLRPWVIGGAVVLAVGLVASRLYLPFVLDIQASRETAALQERLEATQRENRRIQGRLEDVETPRGLEIEARRMDMVREGEMPFRVAGSEPEPRSTAADGAAGEGPPKKGRKATIAVRVSRLSAETASWFRDVIGQMFGRAPGRPE